MIYVVNDLFLGQMKRKKDGLAEDTKEMSPAGKKVRRGSDDGGTRWVVTVDICGRNRVVFITIVIGEHYRLPVTVPDPGSVVITCVAVIHVNSCFHHN